MKRRDFIRQTVAGTLLPSLVHGLSFKAFGNTTEELMGDENVLVVIQLNGGNDGLNTVIPIDKYDLYLNARKNIAIPQEKLLKIPQSDSIGLHPSLTGIQTLMAEGRANLIQSVGTPNPSFSHFRAIDIWDTASESNQYLSNGWAGRYLALNHANYPEGYPNDKFPDPLAIQIGSVASPALQGPLFSMAMSINDATNFYNLITNKVEAAPNTLAGKQLTYLRNIASQTNEYASVIRQAASKVTKQVAYPTNNKLADQLKIVSQLVAGGLKTKIYFVTLEGFDTHSNQTNNTDPTIGNHANLLKTIGDAVQAFMADLKQLGVSQKVIGFTYSEFGRRIMSNDSQGTDHGAAAPMFMFGDKLNSVVLGKNPDIPKTPTANDNIPMQYDFRSVYATILQDWFCLPAASIPDVLLKSIQPLPLIQGQVCGRLLSANTIQDESILMNFPNPFGSETQLTFQTDGGYTLLQIFDTTGRLLETPFEADVAAGSYSLPLQTAHWRSGSYYARLQHNSKQQVRRLMKQ